MQRIMDQMFLKLSSLNLSENQMKNSVVVLNDLSTKPLTTGSVDDVLVQDGFVCLLDTIQKSVIVPVGQVDNELTYSRIYSVLNDLHTKGYCNTSILLAIVGQDSSVLYYTLEIGIHGGNMDA